MDRVRWISSYPRLSRPPSLVSLSRSRAQIRPPPLHQPRSCSGSSRDTCSGCSHSSAPQHLHPSAAPAAPPAPKWYDLVQIQGLADTYYQFRYMTGKPNAPNEFRAFDSVNNSFQLNYAKVAVTTSTNPVSLRLDIGFGPTADASSFDGPSKTASQIFKALEQGFISFKVPSGSMPLVIDAGKFVTWAGSEVVEAKDNWTYSRSMIFTNSPVSHAGVRATWQVTDALALKLAVVNGWDVQNDDNSQKSIGFQLAYTAPAPAATSIFFTTYQGPEAPGFTGPQPWRQFYDLVVNQPIGSQFTLNLNATAQWQFAQNNAPNIMPADRWFGISLMGQYIPTSWLKITGRYEYFNDTDGQQTSGNAYTAAAAEPLIPLGGTAANVTLASSCPPATPKFAINAATVTLGFPIGSNAEVRVEARADFSNKAYFDAGAQKAQVTTTAAALAWF